MLLENRVVTVLRSASLSLSPVSDLKLPVSPLTSQHVTAPGSVDTVSCNADTGKRDKQRAGKKILVASQVLYNLYGTWTRACQRLFRCQPLSLFRNSWRIFIVISPNHTKPHNPNDVFVRRCTKRCLLQTTLFYHMIST